MFCFYVDILQIAKNLLEGRYQNYAKELYIARAFLSARLSLKNTHSFLMVVLMSSY